MWRLISLTLFLFAAWLFLSGHYDNYFLLGAGFASSVLVAFLSYRLSIHDQEGHPVDILWPWFVYLPWLIYQIILTNLDVTKRILMPKMPISPTRFTIKSLPKTDVGIVVLANSITLTPGTITLNIKDNTLDIHALTREAADELREGNMNRRAKIASGEK